MCLLQKIYSGIRVFSSQGHVQTTHVIFLKLTLLPIYLSHQIILPDLTHMLLYNNYL